MQLAARRTAFSRSSFVHQTPRRHNIVTVRSWDDTRPSIYSKASIATQDDHFDSFEEGQLVEGVVKNVERYGAFVDLDGFTAMLHISQVSQERISELDQVLAPGDEVTALVHTKDNERRRIALSTRQLEPTPGEMLRDPQAVYAAAEEMAARWRERRGRGERRGPRVASRAAAQEQETVDTGSTEVDDGRFDSLQAGQVVEGVVQEVRPYGAFVDLGGCKGLLHVSQVSHERVSNAADVLAPGDQLKVLVLRKDAQRRRISLSTKKLEATPGDMLRDPQAVYAAAEETAAKVWQHRDRAAAARAAAR